MDRSWKSFSESTTLKNVKMKENKRVKNEFEFSPMQQLQLQSSKKTRKKLFRFSRYEVKKDSDTTFHNAKKDIHENVNITEND